MPDSTTSTALTTLELNTVFVLRLKIDSEDSLSGHWVGTGDEIYHGEWKLSRLDRAGK